MRSLSNQLIRIPFHQDMIEAAITDDGKLMVNFNRVCNALGINVEKQRQRLVECAWARMGWVSVQMGDEHRIEFMIHHESLAMWLVTLNRGWLRPDFREKLGRFQCELSFVLDAFLGGWQSAHARFRPELDEISDRIAGLEASTAEMFDYVQLVCEHRTDMPSSESRLDGRVTAPNPMSDHKVLDHANRPGKDVPPAVSDQSIKFFSDLLGEEVRLLTDQPSLLGASCDHSIAGRPADDARETTRSRTDGMGRSRGAQANGPGACSQETAQGGAQPPAKQQSPSHRRTSVARGLISSTGRKTQPAKSSARGNKVVLVRNAKVGEGKVTGRASKKTPAASEVQVSATNGRRKRGHSSP